MLEEKVDQIIKISAVANKFRTLPFKSKTQRLIPAT